MAALATKYGENMAATKMKCICKKCNIEFSSIPKRSFLGFQKVICPSASCNTKLIYPLTSGYRTAYWILLILMLLSFLGELSEGRVGFPGGIGIALIFAIWKDRSIKKNTCEIESESTIWKKIGWIAVFFAILVVGVFVREIGTHAVQKIKNNSNEKKESEKISTEAVKNVSSVAVESDKELNPSQIRQIEEIAAEIAKQSNANKHLSVDDMTESFSASSSGRNVRFEYTLRVKNGLSKSEIMEWLVAMQQEIIPKACAQNANNPAFGRGLSYTFAYSSIYGQKMGDVLVDKVTCKRFGY